MPRSLLDPSHSRNLRRGFAVVLTAVALGLAPKPAAGQDPVVLPDSAALSPAGVSPRGAMIRAMLLPGWGHASIGSYNRGALYFLAESAAFWMFSKSRTRLSEAQSRIALREQVVTADLAHEGITDPFEIQARLDQDEGLQELSGLEEARSRQREDWMALSIFLTLISGVDAYVSAHLQDFPDPIEVNVQPVGQGRIEVSARLRLPN
jgi:hypothetical protein